MADNIKSLLKPAIDFLQLKKIGQDKEGANQQTQGAKGAQVDFQKTNENELQECSFEADMKAGSFNFENNFGQNKATEENNMQIGQAGSAQNNAELKGETQTTPENSAPKTDEGAQDKVKGADAARENKGETQNNFFSSSNSEAGFNEELAVAFEELEKLKKG